MSSINLDGNNSAGTRKKAGVQRMLKHNLKVDMTPMVDLGFLLITFFVITTEMAKPTAMDIYMPKEGPPMGLPSSNALTVMLGHDKIYYYTGEWKDAVKNNTIAQTNFSGTNDIRSVIIDRLLYSEKLNLHNEGRDGLMVLIKPAASASYKQIVDVLDEMQISRVKKYALLKITDDELAWLSKEN